MIAHVMNCYWSGAKLSYLRYLSLASFRNQHSEWRINLYGPAPNSGPWAFKLPGSEYGPHDYLEEAVSRLGVIRQVYTPKDPRVNAWPPANQSDIFSYEIMIREGGWYMDLDTFWVKPLDPLCNRNYAFIGFADMCNWVGVFGCEPGSWVMQSIYDTCLENFESGNYNSSGTYGIERLTANAAWQAQFKAGQSGMQNWRCPKDIFYPLLPQQSSTLWTEHWEPSGQTISVHAYGGNEDYAIMSYKMRPEWLRDPVNKDWVSRHARKMQPQLSLINETFPDKVPPHIVKPKQAMTEFMAKAKDFLNDKPAASDVRKVENIPAEAAALSEQDSPQPVVSTSDGDREREGSRDTGTTRESAEYPGADRGLANPALGPVHE